MLNTHTWSVDINIHIGRTMRTCRVTGVCHQRGVSDLHAVWMSPRNLLLVRTFRSFRGHFMNKDDHLYFYVPESLRNNKIDVANHGNVAGTLDDDFKMASNSTHNVHYVTQFILVHVPDIPHVNPPPPRNVWYLLYFVPGTYPNLKNGCHHHQIGMDYLWDAIFKVTAIELVKLHVRL